MTEAIGYVRVSTAEQATSGLGLEAQGAAIRDACAARGWLLVEVHADEGVSGGAVSRPGLDAAVRGCAARKGSVLITAKLDRLARSLTTYALLVDRSEREGWSLCPLDAPDGTSPHGAALQGMVAVFAQLERHLIGQRTREALEAARARGVQLGRPRECPAEVEERIVRLHKRQHLSARAIAAQLDADGVPAPRGGTWQPRTVCRILERAGVELKRGRPRKPQRRRRRVSDSSSGSDGSGGTDTRAARDGR